MRMAQREKLPKRDFGLPGHGTGDDDRIDVGAVGAVAVGGRFQVRRSAGWKRISVAGCGEFRRELGMLGEHRID